MCGICGIAGPVAQNLEVAARDTLAHRGPDGAGEWWSADRRVGLFHRRLAIIDLSPAGHQPMADGSGDLVVVYNGEIYNFADLRAELSALGHGFRSQSDTEVLLAAYRAWGTDCLARLNGMYAFALFDRRDGTLFLARDRAGEKPLFYALHAGVLRFASELKAVLADPAAPRQLDAAALDCYLGLGYVPGERCLLAGYHKLPPAHAAVFDVSRGILRSWRYWELPALAAGPADTGVLADELAALLQDAVRRQLVSDVPLGVLLSGGVDSSVVTALAASARRQLRTFTIRFPNAGSLDETEHARLIARHFGTEHVELVAEPSSVDLLPHLARQFDEPIVDSSMLPTFMVSRLVRPHCTVALGGDGGDELFGGYRHYSRLLALQRRARWVPHRLRQAAIRLALMTVPVGRRGRNWLAAAGADFEREVPNVAAYFDAAARGRLCAGVAAVGSAEAVWDGFMPASGDLLQRATRLDFATYLPEDILVKVDRTAMANSLELRAPFLDYRVIEFAFRRVPSALKATAGSRKVLLKELARRLLPAGFDFQRKQGFSIPLDEWLRQGSWHEFVRAVLLDPQQSWFDHGFVGALLAGQQRGRINGERLFALTLVELWRREYRVTA